MMRTITGILSTCELTLGSYLHLLKIPMAGQLMSLNQCFWLNVSKNWAPNESVSKISMQVAAIKLMTPFGKRVTPMAAIAMQGFLFEMGCFVFGSSFFGCLVGSCLMSVWSFIQPFIVYTFFLGTAFLGVADLLSQKLGLNLFACLLILIVIKAVASMVTCLLARRLSHAVIEKYGSWIMALEKQLTPKTESCGRRVKKIIRSPVFISILTIVLFHYFTIDETELFIRKTLFYICWILAASYFIDLVGAKMLKKVLERVVQGFHCFIF
jgi:hypothetical protein